MEERSALVDARAARASALSCSACANSAGEPTPRWPSSSAISSTALARRSHAAGAAVPDACRLPACPSAATSSNCATGDTAPVRGAGGHQGVRRRASSPAFSNALLYEASEFIETQSFSILPRREAMRALELQRDQLIASDDVVASQVAEMDVALNELGDGQFCMGEYHYSLVVFGERRGRRRPPRGAGHRRGRRGVQPADGARSIWWPTPPGSPRCRATGSGGPRDAKLSSRAFAALASGHNFARGKRDGNPWGEALALLRTPSGQPFYLNLHSSPEGEDSADKKLPGNTLIIGSTGVGKTTLEMFLLTLTRKWEPAPRLVLFDLDRGCEIAMRALGGRYFTLEAGKPTGCNPLQREPDAGAHPVLGAADPHLHRHAGPAADAGRRAGHRRCGQGRGDDAGAPAPLLDRAPEPAQDRREQPLRAARPLVPRWRARLGVRPGRRPAGRPARRVGHRLRHHRVPRPARGAHAGDAVPAAASWKSWSTASG